MNYEQFTLKTQDALQSASSIAQKNDHSEIGLEHILLALLQQQDGIVPPIFERIGVSIPQSLQELNLLLNKYPVVTGNNQISFSAETPTPITIG